MYRNWADIWGEIWGDIWALESDPSPSIVVRKGRKFRVPRRKRVMRA